MRRSRTLVLRWPSMGRVRGRPTGGPTRAQRRRTVPPTGRRRRQGTPATDRCAMLGAGWTGSSSPSSALLAIAPRDRDRRRPGSRAARARERGPRRAVARRRSARRAPAAAAFRRGDLPTLIRRLAGARAGAREFELDQQVRNAAYLADLMGVGIVRLDDDGGSSWRTRRPTCSSRRPPARCAGGRRSRRSSTPGSRT